MVSDLPLTRKREIAKAMKNMPQEEREAAIAASPNVVGYARFIQKNNQVALRGAYKKGRNDDES